MDEYREAKLSDHALIGNCRAAALVSKHGCIDWCCMPEFHSPAVFAALLDRGRGGGFVIQPVDEYQATQQYLDNTNISFINFSTDTGSIRLLDMFVAMDEKDKQAELYPDHEILRIVEGISGSVKLKMEYSPVNYYGKTKARLINQGKLGLHFFYKESSYILTSTLVPSLITVDHHTAFAEFTIREGEQVAFSFSSSSQSPAIIPELHQGASQRFLRTKQYWEGWSAKCSYKGRFSEPVLRSALALKLLAHAPSGAIIAAPTTSLPEVLGGIRNWDYRFCWLRDASFTVRVLIKLGYFEEAHAYMSWILHATRLTWPELQVVYIVYGESKLDEKSCEWLQGYRNSKPVRIGNGAQSQFQLDVYGEVLDAVYTCSKLVDHFDNVTRKFIIGLADVICKRWESPDDGIWEIRGNATHHTHSKVMAWVGLDRVIKLTEKFGWSNVPIQKYKAVAGAIRLAVEEKGFNTAQAHYTQEFDGTQLDAALLVLPLMDYCEAGDPRMENTRKCIEEKLMDKSYVYRYRMDDGLEGDEGAFLVCNFWMVENYAKAGLVKQATDLFTRTINNAGDCGLLSEEIDPSTKELLGNFPQGFSHIGLINAALTIEEALNNGGDHEHR